VNVVIEETIEIAAPPERVFDFITSPDAVGKTFEGHGPIPAATKSEVDGPMRVGAIRRVTNRDGSVIDEEIIELERPRLQRYRLLGGFRGLAKLAVRGAHGRWELAPTGSATRVTWTFTFEIRPLAYPIGALMRGPFRKAMRKALLRTAELIAT
jgi:carbon monoxide dehydrogenase subunit G